MLLDVTLHTKDSFNRAFLKRIKIILANEARTLRVVCRTESFCRTLRMQNSKDAKEP